MPHPHSDRPSPVGLGVAGAGLLLLCISMTLPRVNVEDPVGEIGYYSISGLYGTGSFTIDTATVVLSVALLAAVGLSAYRDPAARWPARLGAVGTAALLAAFSYHPVSVLGQAMELYARTAEFEADTSDAVSQIGISADSGFYIAAVAALLLAASAFLMQTPTRRNEDFAHPGPTPPGGNPTVTVTPG